MDDTAPRILCVEDDHSILHNLKLLFTKLGYRVDCVSPGSYQAERVREQLGEAGTIYPCFFEKLQTPEKYDLIVFSESFHYVDLDLLFEKLPTLLNPSGRILICDFFKIEAPGRCAIRGGHWLTRFLGKVETGRFTCEKDVDITARTAPSIDLLGAAYVEVVGPVRELCLRYVQSSYPRLSKMAWSIMQRLYRKKLRKFNRKLEPGVVNAKRFAEHKSYRLFVLALSQAAG